MFTLFGENPIPTHRREFLRIGGLTGLSLTLPGLLASETRAARPAPASRPRAKSCLLVFMEGGPSHIELFDLKPSAPAEVRGEFRPIPSSVPGIHVGELLPRFGRQMHHLAQVRSVTHTITDHNAGSYYALTGRYPVDGSRLIIRDEPRNFPPIGSVVAKLRPSGGNLPSFVHLPETMSNMNVDIAGQSAGFLGGRYDPLVTGDPSLPDWEVPGLTPAADLTPARLTDRSDLVRRLDGLLAGLPDDANVRRMGDFHRQAFEMIANPSVRRAFDLSQETRAVRDRYDTDLGWDRSLEARQFGGLPSLGHSLLLGRRLLEAGVRLVTVVTGRRYCQAWDTHRDHFGLMRRSLGPFFDKAASALLEDLAQRGLLDETLVVFLGEFGRTPKLGYVTSGAGAAPNGRDHWPFCYTVLFAGAGIRGGTVIGASDRIGAYPSLDPVRPEDVAATIYSLLGIPEGTEIRDNLDRPHNLILGRPIRGLA